MPYNYKKEVESWPWYKKIIVGIRVLFKYKISVKIKLFLTHTKELMK